MHLYESLLDTQITIYFKLILLQLTLVCSITLKTRVSLDKDQFYNNSFAVKPIFHLPGM